jgi:hypothetical protein
MYVPLRGEVEISSLGFKQRSVSWDNFGVVGQISRTSFICPPSPQRHIHKRCASYKRTRNEQEIENDLHTTDINPELFLR